MTLHSGPSIAVSFMQRLAGGDGVDPTRFPDFAAVKVHIVRCSPAGKTSKVQGRSRARFADQSNTLILQILGVSLFFRYFRWSLVLPKLKRQLRPAGGVKHSDSDLVETRILSAKKALR